MGLAPGAMGQQAMACTALWSMDQTFMADFMPQDRRCDKIILAMETI